MITVYAPPPNQPPQASFIANTTNGTAPLAVLFNSTSYDPDGTIVSCHWDFGDGNNFTVQNPNHTFTLPGNYTVKLTVVDNDGLSANSTLLISVSGSSGTPLDTTEEEETSPFPWLIWVLAVLVICWVVVLRRKQRV